MFVIKPNSFGFILPDGYFYNGTHYERGTKPPKIPSGVLLFINPILVYRYYNPRTGGILDTPVEGIVRSGRVDPIPSDYLSLGAFVTGTFFKKNPKRPLYYETNIFFPSRGFDLKEVEECKISVRTWIGFVTIDSWDRIENNGSFLEYQNPYNIDEAVAKISTKSANLKYSGSPTHRVFQSAYENTGPVGAMTRFVFAHLINGQADIKLINRRRLINNMAGKENLSGLVRIINYADASLANTLNITLVSDLNEVMQLAQSKRYQ